MFLFRWAHRRNEQAIATAKGHVKKRTGTDWYYVMLIFGERGHYEHSIGPRVRKHFQKHFA